MSTLPTFGVDLTHSVLTDEVLTTEYRQYNLNFSTEYGVNVDNSAQDCRHIPGRSPPRNGQRGERTVG